MINVSGYKVWPAEVESSLYKYPAIQEAAVSASPTRQRRGREGMVVLRQGEEAMEEEIVDWTKSQMAAHKYLRSDEFIHALPKSRSGKILWRELQEKGQEKMAKAK